jgi:hypothetical protein
MSARKRERILVADDPNQMMIAGVNPVSLGERLTWAAQQPMQPKRAQRPLDIGFWDPMRRQLELF